MTNDEITLLISGVAIGATLINSLNVYWGWRDDRRDRKLIAAAEAKLKAAEEGTT
ncbi:hypothetical protein MBT84_19840 [Streptomyces sp. MBT84]|uniref:hypothetical protein n=1 Tax=Streptomyces sp. MBT84 TaxID=1488414 RepID=UPI001C6F3764|nr:hypothetical protein [Streptomyces sp. MBT84]MBW8701862.1 hypothetical protein [Streptomyces sp. MBT84]